MKLHYKDELNEYSDVTIENEEEFNRFFKCCNLVADSLMVNFDGYTYTGMYYFLVRTKDGTWELRLGKGSRTKQIMCFNDLNLIDNRTLGASCHEQITFLNAFNRFRCFISKSYPFSYMKLNIEDGKLSYVDMEVNQR